MSRIYLQDMVKAVENAIKALREYYEDLLPHDILVLTHRDDQISSNCELYGVGRNPGT